MEPAGTQYGEESKSKLGGVCMDETLKEKQDPSGP